MRNRSVAFSLVSRTENLPFCEGVKSIIIFKRKSCEFENPTENTNVNNEIFPSAISFNNKGFSINVNNLINHLKDTEKRISDEISSNESYNNISKESKRLSNLINAYYESQKFYKKKNIL